MTLGHLPQHYLFYPFRLLIPWTYSNQLLVSNNVYDCIVVKRKALFDDRPVEISVWKNTSHELITSAVFTITLSYCHLF